jgi:hypothetical protein
LTVTLYQSGVSGQGQVIADGISGLEISAEGYQSATVDLPDPATLGVQTVSVAFDADTRANQVGVHNNSNQGNDRFTLDPDNKGNAILTVESGTDVVKTRYVYMHGMTSNDSLHIDTGIYADNVHLDLDASYAFNVTVLGENAVGDNLHIDAQSFVKSSNYVFVGRSQATFIGDDEFTDIENDFPIESTVFFPGKMHEITINGPNINSIVRVKEDAILDFNSSISAKEDAIFDGRNLVDVAGTPPAQDLTFNGGNGSNIFHLDSASGRVTLTAGTYAGSNHTPNQVIVAPGARAANLNFTGAGATHFEVPFANFPNGFAHGLNITAGLFDTLEISDPIYYGLPFNNYVIDSNRVSVQRFSAPASLYIDQLTYSGLKQLSLTTVAAPFVQVIVEATTGRVLHSTVITTHGQASSSVLITPDSQNLAQFIGSITVKDGGAGNTDLVIDDQDNTFSPNYTVDPTTVTWQSSAITLSDGETFAVYAFLNFSGIRSLTLQAGYDAAQADTFSINGPQAPRTTITDFFGSRLADVDPDTVDINGLAGVLKLQTYGSPTLHGPLQLSYATLTAIKGSPAAPGDVPLTIIDNDSGALTGAFDNLQDGATFTTNDGLKLRITYKATAEEGRLDTQVTYLNTPPVVTGTDLPSTSTDGGTLHVATEGEAISGHLFFTDPDLGQTHHAVIDWSDGHSDTYDVSAGALAFQISHIYAEEGSYSVKATVTDASGAAGTFAFYESVEDASLGLQDANNPFVEGLPHRYPLAILTDPGNDGTVADYSVTIEWGDGTRGSGTVQKLADGTLGVFDDGTHVYSGDEGTGYTLVIRVSDIGGAFTSISIPVVITDPANTPPRDFEIDDMVNDAQQFPTTNVFTIQAYRGALDEVVVDDLRISRNGYDIFAGTIESLTSITINVYGFNDIINIEGAYPALPIHVNLYGGTNTVNVYPARSLLGADQGNITILGGGSGQTTVNVHDETDANVSWTLGNNAVTGTALGQGKISFDALTALNIFGGSGANTYAVQDTAGVTTETITVGTGTDVIHLGTPASNLDGVGSLKVNGNNQTALVLDDEANHDRQFRWIFGTGRVQTRPTYVITGQKVIRTNQVTQTFLSAGQIVNTITSSPLATVQYSGIGVVYLQGGASPNVFNVQGTQLSTPIVIRPGAAGDTVNVGSAANTLDPIQGAVTILGAANATLNFNDQNGTPGAVPNQLYRYSLAQDSFSRTGTATVSFSGMATVNLYAANAGGSGGNVLGVPSTAPGTITNVYAGTGLNEFLVFDLFYTLNGIQGPLNLHGTSGSLPNDDLVEIDDVDKTARHVFYVNAGATSQSGMVQRYNAAGTQTDAALITYDGLNAYAVLYTAGSAGHTINVQSNASDLWTIVGADATDTVNVGNSSHTLAAVQGDLRIQGGKPTVYIDDSADAASRSIDMASDPFYHNYLITGLLPQSDPLAGRLWLQLDPSAPVAIYTGTADDTFRVHDLVGIPDLTLNGGGGTNNTLDYSAYQGDVTVDLPLGYATGFAGGIASIQNVTGSQGNDILVGDANANVLRGGTGRSLIIGGAGADQLFGGNLDNLMIGGYTKYDANLLALQAFMAEWTSADSYGTRVKKISNGVLASDGKTYALIPGKGASQTVFDDGVTDVLTGTPNADASVLDWLFSNKTTDKVVNPKAKDTLTPIF